MNDKLKLLLDKHKFTASVLEVLEEGDPGPWVVSTSDPRTPFAVVTADCVAEFDDLASAFSAAKGFDLFELVPLGVEEKEPRQIYSPRRGQVIQWPVQVGQVINNLVLLVAPSSWMKERSKDNIAAWAEKMMEESGHVGKCYAVVPEGTKLCQIRRR